MHIFIGLTSKLIMRGRFGRRGRPRMMRQVAMQLGADYFAPVGAPDGTEVVVLKFEELEAVRLVDLLGLEQEAAAKEMEISRGTLWRELESARKKIADALVNGKIIQIKGGDYEMAGRGRMGGFGLGPGGDCVCPSCGYTEQHARGVPCYQRKCPKCGSTMTRTR